MTFLRQTWTLTKKDLNLVAWRRWLSTFLRAIALPIAYIFFISYVRNFFLPASEYGFGSPRPIRNLTTEVFNSDISLGGRDRVAFIHNGYTGGQIEDLITALTPPLEEAGVDVRILSSDEELLEVCRSSLRGLSRCYAAASFHASPTEGRGGLWSYTARTDFALGLSVYVGQPDNDAQIYVLPFVHAIDSGIASLSGTSFPDTMLEYPFTHQTMQERDDEIQTFFMRALARYLAVTLFIGICGVAYHLPGHVATEREIGMSSLIDAMIPSTWSWNSLSVRLTSAYISFTAIYLLGWLAMGIIVAVLIFYHTATSIVVLFHMLAGLSLTGYAMFGASLFRKAQLSGITVLLVSLVLAILCQFMPQTTLTVAVLSVIFPPITYTSFMIYLAEWELMLRPANLMRAAPGSTTDLAGYVYFICLAVQTILFPIFAAILQWALFSSSQGSRKYIAQGHESTTIRLLHVSKHFLPNPLRRLLSTLGLASRQDPVKAVDEVTLSALTGNIVTLLGSNGSGKSTLVSMIAGMQSITSGFIEMKRNARLGVCPQHNVLWNDLTVLEHTAIFNGLKSQHEVDTKATLQNLIIACDLGHKMNARSKTLSGGQKRKLQLAMAFTGGSEICCVDEVSSGLDPLSRRKIWQILLSERGRRTILLTTHALDEADALSDQIAVMSKGKVIAAGSAVELKHRYGGGYKITIPKGSEAYLPNPSPTRHGGAVTFHAKTSLEASELATDLQSRGIEKFDVAGPSIEDVFLALASKHNEELSDHSSLTGASSSSGSPSENKDPSAFTSSTTSTGLAQGRGTSFVMQVRILLRKRFLILTRNYLPYIFAMLIAVLTAGLTIMFLGGFDRLVCSPSQLANNPTRISLPVVELYWGVLIPAGPSDRFSTSQLPATYRPYLSRVRLQDKFEDFQTFTENNFRDVIPGGFYLGDNATAAPLMSYRIDGNLGYAALAKNVLDSVLLNTTIVADFSTFALPFISSTGDSLQLVLYFGFAMCAYPAFFALYPTFERLGNIRALHYSNGVRPGSLWLSYILFDSVFVLLISILTVVVFTSVSILDPCTAEANAATACRRLVRSRLPLRCLSLVRGVVHSLGLYHLPVYID
jgi:ATP-binding cassette, subfamily A (ABC1), member 3